MTERDVYWFFPERSAIDVWRESGPRDVVDLPAFGDCPARLLPPGEMFGTLYLERLPHPPRIEWARVSGSRWRCGFDVRPRPRDLERGVPLIGYDVTLGDGQAWKVPVVLPFTGRDMARIAGLPGEPAIAEGRLRYCPLVRYEPLINQAREVKARPTDPDLVLAFAVECLGVGYRVSWHEVCGLGLLPTMDEAIRVAQAALDAPEAGAP